MGKPKTNFLFKPFESTKANDKYIRLAHTMLESSAWHDLCSSGKILYLEFKKKYNGKNRDDLSVTYSESSLVQKVYRTAIYDLIRKGFVEIIHEGKVTRTCNTYKLSSDWSIYPNNKFKNPTWVNDRIKNKTFSPMSNDL